MRYVILSLVLLFGIAHAADWYCYTQLGHTAVCAGPIKYTFCK